MVLMADKGRYMGGAFVTFKADKRQALWDRVAAKTGAPPPTGLAKEKAEWLKPGLVGLAPGLAEGFLGRLGAMPSRETPLETAERHVREGEERIARQRRLIDQLAQDGHPTDDALRVLQDFFQEIQAQQIQLLELLRII